jgi:hypothetical protein
MFFREQQPSIKVSHPQASFGQISKIVAGLWEVLDASLKEEYKKRSANAKKDYLKLLATYRATQVNNTTQIPDKSDTSNKKPSKKHHKTESDKPFHSPPKNHNAALSSLSTQTPNTGTSYTPPSYNQQSYMTMQDDLRQICNQQSYGNYHQQQQQQQRLSPYTLYQCHPYPAHYDSVPQSYTSTTASQDYFHDQHNAQSYNYNGTMSYMANTNPDTYANWPVHTATDQFHQQNSVMDENSDFSPTQEQRWYDTATAAMTPQGPIPITIDYSALQQYHSIQQPPIQPDFLVDTNSCDYNNNNNNKYQNFNNWTSL